MNRLSEFRKRQGLSQARLASQSGVSHSYIAQLEQGGGLAGVDIADALARVLAVDPDQLFPRVPRRSSESRQEFFARCYPELVSSLNQVDALRFSIALASMSDSMFQSLTSAKTPLPWPQVIELVFCFLRAIGRQARLEELMKED